MSKSYIIQWKSKVNGRAGRGTKQFGREEARQLVEELNRDYPQIEHEPVAAGSSEGPGAEKTEAESQQLGSRNQPLSLVE